MNSNIVTSLILSVAIILIGGFVYYLLNLEAASKVDKEMHIVVICKDPNLSYSEPATGSDELKCDWKTVTWVKR